MAIVKSNAYGHGLLEVAEAVKHHVDWFGVDSIDEATALRRSGVTHPILVLGFIPKARFRELSAQDLSCVIYDRSTVRELAALSDAPHPIKVHVKIETGTNRLGIAGDDLRVLARSIRKAGNIVIEGAYTHFADAEEGARFAKKQLKRFSEGLDILKEEGIVPRVRHAACSAAILTMPDAHFDMVRLGISLYGLWPSSFIKDDILRRTKKGGTHAASLKPVLSWKTTVAQVKHVKKGETVGYGCTERLTKDRKVAVIPVGYYDGYDRGLGSSAAVLIRGQRCKILGRICMNMCMADVTAIARVRMGDEVVLIGRQGNREITAEDLAAMIGTINYEIVTRINPLIPRLVG